MMDCKNSRRHEGLPILYKVKPKDLEHQSGMLGEIIWSCEKLFDEKVVDEWERALPEIRSLKGWDSEKDVNRYEGDLVKLVIIKVLSELKVFDLVFTKHLIRINGPIEDVMILVYHNSIATIIGIYGMGGIGKIVFANVIYNKLAAQRGTN